MSELDFQSFKALCEEILAGAGSRLAWTWDTRFEAVVSTLDSDQASLMHDLLRKRWPTPWVSDTLSGAPESVLEIAKSLGGLKAKQELFVTEPAGPTWLIAAWWPWQGAPRVSLRLLLRTQIFTTVDLNEELRAWFGIHA